MNDLRHVLGLLELDRFRVLRAVLMASVTLAAAASLAAISAWLITRAWEQPPVLDLTVAVVAVRALGIGRGVSRYLDRLAGHDVALRGAARARERLYERLAEAGTTPALRTGDVLLRSGRDLDVVADTVVRVIIPAAVAAVLSLGSVLALALLSPVVAVVMAVAVLAAGVVAPVLAARAALGSEREASAATSDQAAAAVLVVDHAAELAVGGRLDSTIDSITDAGGRRRSAELSADAASARAVAAVPAAMTVTAISALLAGIAAYGTGAGHGPTWIGMLVLFPLAAFEALTALPGAAEHVSRAIPAAERIRSMVEEPRRGPASGAVGRGGPVSGHHRPARDDSADLLSVVALEWGPEGRALAGGPLDLVLSAGDRVVVRGPSGSGKSTLARVLAGLQPPVSGGVSAAGEDLSLLDRPLRRQRVIYLAEDARIFDTTLRDNLLVARGDAPDEELLAALEQVGLGSWVDGLPGGLNTVLEGGDEATSAGQRRRLLLARALLVPAPVLVLDEPTEHLSADDAGTLMQRICDAGPDGLFGAERAVVVVTHDRATPLQVSKEIEL
ncbi:thiol reductant ABC exporter subunit CydC [Dietzia sp. ANT_WB102]|uniref:thiol reductant ABC exporter subunit CydC n=1 Tax=Dietzia sp. ANT_WB102 TaxID=2597345 RepID=UPI0011EE1563|nr:thiol reductant ABC exporter subunit CydC [Dietzia sp. ANT_WB102]KAA0916489.1 thiol reductant ABC exporter subunit CydC [Dietzia sp. ANT_WB102]